MTMPYKCIIADPPWAYSDKMLKMKSTGNGCATQYKTMSYRDICELLRWKEDTPRIINQPIADDAHLWLWVTNAFIEDGHNVVRAWGFEPKTIVTWVKGRLEGSFVSANARLVQHIGQGHYLRNSTEHVIFAVRGRCPALVKNLPTAFVYPGRWPGRLHSEKPPTIHEWAERLSPGPRVELFARRKRDGWDAIGDEVK